MGVFLLLPEQVDIQKTQGAEDTRQKNHTNQQCGDDAAAVFVGTGAPGTVFVILFVHRKTSKI